MADIYLLEGPVGAGKSTFALQLQKENRVHLCMDDWMASLFKPDRPESGFIEWYSERKGRCIRQMWKVANAILHTGTDVILELGLIRRDARELFFNEIDLGAHRLKVYVLDAPKEIRRERVRRRNRDKGLTFSMEVPDEMFELASNFWEPFTEEEATGLNIRFITT